MLTALKKILLKWYAQLVQPAGLTFSGWRMRRGWVAVRCGPGETWEVPALILTRGRRVCVVPLSAPPRNPQERMLSPN